MFFYEFCELFKNTYYKEDLGKAGSKTPVRRFLFNKVASLMAQQYLAQVFFCEFCEIFRKAFLQKPSCNHF